MLAGLAGAFLLLLLLFLSLNAWNLPFLRPNSAGLILLFTGLSVTAFLLFVLLLVLLSRNILKLYADQRSRVLGSRLRSRMLFGALLLSILPATFMFFFSYLLLNRSIDRWFSQPVVQLREDSTRIALELSHYAATNARLEAESLASSAQLASALEANDSPKVLEVVRTHRITLEGGFVIAYRDQVPVARYQVPPQRDDLRVTTWLDNREASVEPSNEPLTTVVLHATQRSDEPALRTNGGEYALGAAETAQGGVVVVGLPMPAGLSATVAGIRQGAETYWAMFRARNGFRRLSISILLLLTALTLFTSSWLALFLSKQVTRPVEALADAMEEIAAGHYKHRITVDATQELGELIRSFNHMAADLEESRSVAESSRLQLSAANAALDERRRELETILETIPSGVVTLDQSHRVLQANRTFIDLLPPEVQPQVIGAYMQDLFAPEVSEELTRLVRRAKRMGVAATELELTSNRGPLSLSATAALLDFSNNQRSCILVIEDVTEFLQAQRQVAWKEVAQRVAHEIKNPLTPIGLSAERIKKHVDRPTVESSNVIRRCSEVILGSVQTVRTLVDQFAALAEFPTAQPHPSDLNAIVENALLLFAGRLTGISIHRDFAPDLPPVMADGEALKRAIANLIDNAAEAMQGSLLRQLSIETSLNVYRGMAEVMVADTGHGISENTRERLFLPYFSTKQRGTGLGLSIAAKIVQEHHGSIRAEQNSPVGARFIIELPLAEVSAAGVSEPARVIVMDPGVGKSG